MSYIGLCCLACTRLTFLGLSHQNVGSNPSEARIQVFVDTLSLHPWNEWLSDRESVSEFKINTVTENGLIYAAAELI